MAHTFDHSEIKNPNRWFSGHLGYFPIYWECHHPIWLIFFRGVGLPPAFTVTQKRIGGPNSWGPMVSPPNSTTDCSRLQRYFPSWWVHCIARHWFHPGTEAWELETLHRSNNIAERGCWNDNQYLPITSFLNGNIMEYRNISIFYSQRNS